MESVSDPGSTRTGLTVREQEIMRRVALGWTNAEIAGDLHLSVHAVKYHLHRAFRKLRAANRTEAAIAFLRARDR